MVETHPQEEVVLDVRNLTKTFPVRGRHAMLLGGRRKMLHAVDDVSFTLRRGEILALVGESGSGKSTIARLISRLYPATSGQALLYGQDIFRLRHRGNLLRLHRRVQMVFQDPFGSLNPVKTVGHHIERPLRIHHIVDSGKVDDETFRLLAMVGLVPEREIAGRLPHQLSGGQRQRVSFARALAVQPDVLLADEPISMLDVSIRMGILNLMGQLRDAQGLSLLYITHDIASARYLADRTMVLYAGQVMESAPSDALVMDPLHPYTQLLLSAVPDPQMALVKRAVPNRGEATPAVDPRPGCRFASRCPHVMDVCRRVTPELLEVKPKHWVRCHLYPAAYAPHQA